MRIRIVALMGLTACVAAADAMSPPSLEVGPDCTNAIIPDSFRAVYWNGSGPETTKVLKNRYVLPHRSADTIPLGAAGKLITNPDTAFNPAQCWTLFDSLWTWLPNGPGPNGTTKVMIPSMIEVLRMRRKAKP